MKIGRYEVTWYQALAVALTALFFYMVLTRIFGHSATDFALTTTLFGMLGTWLYNLNREVGELKTELKNFKESIHEEFQAIKHMISKGG